MENVCRKLLTIQSINKMGMGRKVITSSPTTLTFIFCVLFGGLMDVVFCIPMENKVRKLFRFFFYFCVD